MFDSFLKQQGDTDLPMTNIFSLSLIGFAAAISVTQILLYFPPTQASDQSLSELSRWIPKIWRKTGQFNLHCKSHQAFT